MSKHKNKTLFEASYNLTTNIFDSYSIYLIKIIEDWNKIVPKAWENTFPIKIQWEKNNTAILYVATPNKYFLNLLTYDEPIVINKINEYFGYNCISKIKFKTNA